ncbi:MAG: FGGY family carbohydrate kinase [Saprospiraceae bacterium]
MYLLGYDIGSSSIKIALIKASDKSVVWQSNYPEQEMDIISGQTGWAEQSPEVWWQDFCVATNRMLEQTKINPEEVLGIGLSYQMHGLVLLDKDRQVLRPAIIWCDSRSVGIGEEAYEALGKNYCENHLLNAPGNFTASKLKWVKDNEPDVFHKIDKIILPGDFIAMKLTGEINTTISGLSEGIFWDFKEKKISRALLDHFGFDQEVLASRRSLLFPFKAN